MNDFCFTLFYEKDSSLSGLFFWTSAKQLANYKVGALQTAPLRELESLKTRQETKSAYKPTFSVL